MVEKIILKKCLKMAKESLNKKKDPLKKVPSKKKILINLKKETTENKRPCRNSCEIAIRCS